MRDHLHIYLRIIERQVPFGDKIQILDVLADENRIFIVHVSRRNELTPDSRITDKLHVEIIIKACILRHGNLCSVRNGELERNKELTGVYHIIQIV